MSDIISPKSNRASMQAKTSFLF